MDIFVRNSPTLSQFKHNLIQIIRPPKQSTFSIHDVEGLKLLTRLRVKFSDLREHRFWHNFRCNSPNCLCGKGIEDNEHFLLHCHRYGSSRRAFLDCVSSSVNFDNKAFSSSDLCNFLLYGDPRLNLHINHFILESTLHFINQTKRFKKLVDEDPVQYHLTETTYLRCVRLFVSFFFSLLIVSFVVVNITCLCNFIRKHGPDDHSVLFLCFLFDHIKIVLFLLA